MYLVFTPEISNIRPKNQQIICLSYLHNQEWDISYGLKVLDYQVTETYEKYHYIAFLLKIQEKLPLLKTTRMIFRD